MKNAHWFDSYVTRCEHRREGRLLDVAAYLALRDLTGAVRLEMDATERVGDYEVPPPVLESGSVQAMRLIAMRAINITQDVQSLAKEEATGDLHNMVIVLERQQACTRHEALEQIHMMIRGYTDSFLEHEAEIPQLLDALRISVEDRAPAYRYMADLRSLIRGGADFCSKSGRYK
jgi:hypothetical protein